MPRSSRSKSHKQSKHSSKETATAREYSGSDDDAKMRERSINGGKEDGVSVRVSKDSSVSVERRKHGKDLSISHGNHGNGDVSEEHTTSSKRREEKSHGGSDRWNGGSTEIEGLAVNIENKESLKSKDFSKVSSESKSKSNSRRHDADSVSVVALEKDEIKSSSSKRGEKRKSEKEYTRKENKESKDKDRSSDRARKSHSDKLEIDASSKQADNQSSRRGKEITGWPIEEELRNPELEKELEKRMRRRGEASSDKDKYQDFDIKHKNDRYKDEKHKNDEYSEDSYKETRQKDEKHREDGERDRKNRDSKHRGESERYHKHRDDKYHEDKYTEDGNNNNINNKDNKYKDEKYIDITDKDEKNRDGKHKQDDDRDYRHKEDKYRDVKHEKRTRDSKYTSKDHIDEPETKRLRDDSVGSDLYYKKTNNRDGSPCYDDRVRYKDDKDRRRGIDKDKDTDKDESGEYRSCKEQRAESDKRPGAKIDSGSDRGRPGSRYADVELPASHSRRRSSPSSYPSRDHHRYEDRSRHRDYTSAPAQPDKKVNPKDDSYTRAENDKESLDLEELGPRSGGSKDNVKETHPDNDNLSVSSPYPRNSHFSGNNYNNNNSKSLLPPPSSPFFGSTEDDRNKSNNRNRRMVDQNMGRNQNNWKNVPNWPSPMTTGGYIPFQHVPPPMFHPLMQQFPPPIFGRPPMKLNPGLPYHVPDHGRPLTWRNDEPGPPPVHGWDANNGLFGPDWDRRTQMSNRGWDHHQSMESQSGRAPSDEVWSGQTGQPDDSEMNQPEIQTPALSNLERNVSETQKVTEIPQIVEVEKIDDSIVMSKAYLTRVDVSEDLTQPELYEQCTSIMDLDNESLSDEFECKILFLEEGVEASTSLFAAINDSVFQKAMFRYKKQKEEFHSVPLINGPVVDEEKDGKSTVEMEIVSEEKEKPAIEKLDTEANDSNKAEEMMVKQEEEELIVEEKSCVNLLACKIEEAIESTNDEMTGGGSDVSMATESIEFGSVNLNQIHHHSPESTH